MSPLFERVTELDWGARRISKYTTERGELTSYSVTLSTLHEGRWHTVRVYDNAHGQHEMHRHTLAGGKQTGEVFHHGTASDAYNSARSLVDEGYEEMITAWLR